MADVLCPVMVGRQAELAALDVALAAALAGAGRLMFVAGEPGIGKSRLAREMAERARAAGARVVTGRAVPAGQSTPYRPLTEALHQALRDEDRALAEDPELRPWWPALAAVVPGLAGSHGWAGEPSAAVLGEAVLRLLGRLAAGTGLMIVLEDLHWADPDTLTVVEYLADNLDGQRVLGLATGRDEPATALLDLARRLRGRRAAGHLALARLDGDQVAAMVLACLPAAGPDVIARVTRTADGVPFLVEEVLAAPGVPASFRDTVRARLAASGEPERLVLRAAAVLGRHFDWRLLSAVTGQDAGVVARALEGGVDQLLLSVRDGEFRFRHALTREAIAADVLPPTRQALAAAALAALDRPGEVRDTAWRDTAADLALQAGQAERAGSLLIESGRESLRRGALATAVQTFSRAASLPGPPQDRAEAGLVEALALAGRFDEAMTVGAGLIARLEGAERARVHLRLAHAAVAATRWPIARDQLLAAASLLADAPGELRAEALVLRAEVAMAAGDLAGARRLADGALGIAAARAGERCHALEIVGRSLRLTDRAAAAQAFERALDLASAQDLPFWRLRALHELGTIELFGEAGRRRLIQARQMAGELGAMSTAAVLDLQLAAAAEARYELDELARLAQESLEISERLGIAGVRSMALVFLLESRALRGDRAGTEHYAGLALAAAEGDAVVEAFVWGAGLAMQALIAGDRAAARAAFDRSAEILRGCPHANPACFRAMWLVVLAADGDPRAAAEIQAAGEAGITAVFFNEGLTRCAEAILAGRAGHADRAGELAAAGRRALVPFPIWSALAWLHVAEAALADGWGEPREWLAAARSVFGDHGLDVLARRCGELLGPGWVSLGVTAREADVLRLIAEGLANKEIAARLFLSPRTVEKHVESLLRKTGARSRTQLLTIAGKTT